MLRSFKPIQSLIQINGVILAFNSSKKTQSLSWKWSHFLCLSKKKFLFIGFRREHLFFQKLQLKGELNFKPIRVFTPTDWLIQFGRSLKCNQRQKNPDQPLLTSSTFIVFYKMLFWTGEFDDWFLEIGEFCIVRNRRSTVFESLKQHNVSSGRMEASQPFISSERSSSSSEVGKMSINWKHTPRRHVPTRYLTVSGPQKTRNTEILVAFSDVT